MHTEDQPTHRRWLAAAVLAAVAATATSCGSSSPRSSAPAIPTTAPPPTTTAPTATGSTAKLSPAAKLILKLGKPPANASLPDSLQGASTQATPLSAGSRKHHAAGAIVTTNGGALVGYLIFKTRRDALADLAAYPPNTGPNKVVARSMEGLPKPTYVLRAPGNGYVSRYVVFVDGPVIVNTWAYGKKGGTEAELNKVVSRNAHWALQRLEAARRAVG